MKSKQVLRQRQWTEAELHASKLLYYAPRKQVVMVRVVETTMGVKKTLEILTASKGDLMIYDPGDGQAKAALDDYEHWPVRSDLFRKTYKPWVNHREWKPNPAELQLMTEFGCLPYYKATGVWAIRLEEPRLIQSLESPKPVEVPPGRWLVIGTEGEPYHVNDRVFRQRYIVPNP